MEHKTLVLLFNFALVSLTSHTQIQSKRIFTCSYLPANLGLQQCSIEQQNAIFTDKKAENAVNKILDPLGLPANFVLVPCPNIQNAKAITLDDGIRYILYDQNFMDRLDRDITDWASTSILAHEIGHHLCGHTLKKAKSNAEQRTKEIQADDFSGFVMFKLGATLEQAKATISVYESDDDDTNSDHPNRTKRLAAVEKGYKRAKDQQSAGLVVNDQNVEEYYNAGNKLIISGKFQDAIDKLTIAIQLKPNYAALYNLRGAAKLGFQKDNEAIADCNRAIALNPRFASAYVNRGSAKMDLDDYTGAIADYNIAIALEPDSALNYDARASAKFGLKDYPGAIADESIAIGLDPTNATSYSTRGAAKLATGDKEGGCADFKNGCRLGYSECCKSYNQLCK